MTSVIDKEADPMKQLISGILAVIMIVAICSGALGEGAIKNPMVSLVQQMQQYMETAKQAEAMQAFDGFFSSQDGEATGWAELINEVPAKEDDGTITPGIMEAGSHFTWVSQDEEGNRIRTAPCRRSLPT